MYFLWLDMEMSGLNPFEDKILEVAVIVTDEKLVEHFCYETVIFQNKEILEQMNEWCKKQHRESGLISRIATGISEKELDIKLINICKNYWRNNEKIILCGNSIWQDRRFIEQYLYDFSSLLHYRMLDVSSFKLVFENLYHKKYTKKNAHRALDDIRESVFELKHYLNCIDINKYI